MVFKVLFLQIALQRSVFYQKHSINIFAEFLFRLRQLLHVCSLLSLGTLSVVCVSAECRVLPLTY